MLELNIFQKIIQGLVPCERIWENAHALCFKDIEPKAPVHALLVPKKHYLHALDFYANASDLEILSLQKGIANVIHILNLQKNGCRIITNQGLHGRQEVHHFHLHILGGALLPNF